MNMEEDIEDQILLKEQAQHVLQTLMQESDEIHEFYASKISQLYDEIAAKDNRIESLEEQLKFVNKKYSNLGEELTQKQRIIDRLNKIIESQERKFKQSVHNYIQQLDFSFNGVVPKQSSFKSSFEKNKTINISEYFLKTVERSRDVSRCQQDISCQTSTFSTLHPLPNGQLFIPKKKHTQQLARVKSMTQQKLSRDISNFLPHESLNQSPQHEERMGGNSGSREELLKTQKNQRWKNLSALPERSKKNGVQKFLFY